MHPPHQLQMPTAAATPRPRPKRATAPLNEAVRARFAVLPSCADSSGSDHEAAALSSLVNEYLLEANMTAPSAAPLTVDGSDAEDEHDGGTRSDKSSAVLVLDEIKCILDSAAGSPDKLHRQFLADVMDAMHGLEDVRPNRSAFRRVVMSRLRERGHQAGLCKARWEKSGNMAAGSYEYIDVVVTSETRYIVDIGFAAEFEVARPTLEYEVIWAGLPEVLIARPEDVRQVVKAAGLAARHSLKSRGLSVPPWRKRRFMMAKWLGPYKRTVSSVPASAGAAMPSSGVAPICRTIIGFAPPTPTVTSSGIWG